MRESVSGCLLAAQQRWGIKCLDAIARFAAEIRDGINPASLIRFQRCMVSPYQVALEQRMKVCEADGAHIVEQHLRAMTPGKRLQIADGMVAYCGSGEFHIDLKLGSAQINCVKRSDRVGRPWSRSIEAGIEEAREAVGLLLVTSGVHLQHVAASGPGS